MTRQEFINDIQYWSELLEFCYDEECYICDDVYDSDQWNNSIDENVSEMAGNDSWRDILATLQDYENISGYDYYRRNDYGEWYALEDDDFDSYKDDVMEWMDNNDRWDEDEEEEEDPPQYYVDPEDVTPLEAEDVSMDDLFLSGIEALKASQNTVPDEADFNSLLSA